ncbi:MAG: hypothetical protein D4R80_00970 [Deltaproteobacteria bacterium]|nr:MAG: hypothetical protein D4R80_00970 [Deltaproteobacteria bacterium]
MKFHDAEIRAMVALGVPRNIITYWENGGGIGKTYAPTVAKVLGKTLEEVLYPKEEKNGKGTAA